MAPRALPMFPVAAEKLSVGFVASSLPAFCQMTTWFAPPAQTVSVRKPVPHLQSAKCRWGITIILLPGNKNFEILCNLIQDVERGQAGESERREIRLIP